MGGASPGSPHVTVSSVTRPVGAGAFLGSTAEPLQPHGQIPKMREAPNIGRTRQNQPRTAPGSHPCLGDDEEDEAAEAEMP